MIAAELLRPFEFEFFRNGLVVATMAGACAGWSASTSCSRA